MLSSVVEFSFSDRRCVEELTDRVIDGQTCFIMEEMVSLEEIFSPTLVDEINGGDCFPIMGTSREHFSLGLSRNCGDVNARTIHVPYKVFFFLVSIRSSCCRQEHVYAHLILFYPL